LNYVDTLAVQLWRRKFFHSKKSKEFHPKSRSFCRYSFSIIRNYFRCTEFCQ